MSKLNITTYREIKKYLEHTLLVKEKKVERAEKTYCQTYGNPYWRLSHSTPWYYETAMQQKIERTKQRIEKLKMMTNSLSGKNDDDPVNLREFWRSWKVRASFFNECGLVKEEVRALQW